MVYRKTSNRWHNAVPHRFIALFVTEFVNVSNKQKNMLGKKEKGKKRRENERNAQRVIINEQHVVKRHARRTSFSFSHAYQQLQHVGTRQAVIVTTVIATQEKENSLRTGSRRSRVKKREKQRAESLKINSHRDTRSFNDYLRPSKIGRRTESFA